MITFLIFTCITIAIISLLWETFINGIKAIFGFEPFAIVFTLITFGVGVYESYGNEDFKIVMYVCAVASIMVSGTLKK